MPSPTMHRCELNAASREKHDIFSSVVCCKDLLLLNAKMQQTSSPLTLLGCNFDNHTRNFLTLNMLHWQQTQHVVGGINKEHSPLTCPESFLLSLWCRCDLLVRGGERLVKGGLKIIGGFYLDCWAIVEIMEIVRTLLNLMSHLMTLHFCTKGFKLKQLTISRGWL